MLLVLTTVIIASITLSLSGKAYTKVDPEPFRELKTLSRRLQAAEPMPTSVIVALTMPIILNILLFLPWGFLMFIVLDKPERPTNQSYLLTVLLAMAFSCLVEAWQYFLPTRVTDINDVIWNGSGALFGAVLGHLRKRVRVAFE
jgi:glycopeptide antibiotics resistance protein